MKKFQFDKKYLDISGLGLYLSLRFASIFIFILLIGGIFTYRNYSNQTRAINSDVSDTQIKTTLKLPQKELALAEKYASDYEAMHNQQVYNNSSLLMQIDPENKRIATFRYALFSNDENFWFNEAVTRMANIWKTDETYLPIIQKIMDNLGLETEPKYLKELVNIDTSVAHQITITICAPTEEFLELLVNEINTCFVQQTKPEVEKLMGSFKLEKLQDYHMITRDTALRDLQTNNINYVSSLQTSLNTQTEGLSVNTQKYLDKYLNRSSDTDYIFGDPISYTEDKEPIVFSKKSLLTSGIKGILAGIVVWFLLFTTIFAFTPAIWTGRNITDSFGLPFSGYLKTVVISETVNKRKRKIWKSFEKRLTKKERILTSAYINYLYKGYTQKEDGTVCLVLCSNLLSAADLENTVQTLASKDGCKLSIIDAKSILSDAKAGDTLTNADAILLSHIIGKETYGQLDHVLTLLQPYEDKIIGDVLLF